MIKGEIMNEKRFYIESNGIWDEERPEKQLSWSELENLLNNYQITNNELTNEINKLCHFITFQGLTLEDYNKFLIDGENS